jgi:hypothetical protein
MAVELIKTGVAIQDGLLVHPDQIVCGLCDQSYDLRYSSGEADRLNDWLPKAKQAVNASHANDHPATIAVSW